MTVLTLTLLSPPPPFLIILSILNLSTQHFCRIYLKILPNNMKIDAVLDDITPIGMATLKVIKRLNTLYRNDNSLLTALLESTCAVIEQIAVSDRSVLLSLIFNPNPGPGPNPNPSFFVGTFVILHHILTQTLLPINMDIHRSFHSITEVLSMLLMIGNQVKLWSNICRHPCPGSGPRE
jgi:hypothetical protein